jgi:cytochrome c peroxidase
MKHKKFLGLLSLVAVLSGGIMTYTILNSSGDDKELVLGHGNLDALQGVFTDWQKNYEAKGGSPTTLHIAMAYSKAFSTNASKAKGYVELDLMTGQVSVKVKDLDNQTYDVWLVDNHDGDNRTVKPETGDGFYRLGSLSKGNVLAKLNTQINREDLDDFKIDMVVVTPTGTQPDQSVVIAGAPDLLQTLYYSNKPWAQASVGNVQAPISPKSTFDFLLPTLANASSPADQADLAAVMGSQIAEGRRLFINETFNGNGRTCTTCHRLDNNHTIDPKYIATLPPTDPLFVAETNPALANLEKPDLMRKLGLILTNIDGFDHPAIMRSVPHTLGLAKSITTEKVINPGFGNGDAFDVLDETFANALGWSGDGSTGTGSLREFTIGAIEQHFPKTLNRISGSDFRFPTDAELNAIQAYLLSLGRSQEVTLAKMTFNSPIVQRGKVLFDVKNNPKVNNVPVLGTSANCNGCHSNAGALSSTTGGNPTRNTGVELMKDQPGLLLDPTLAVDGGIGTVDIHGGCAGADPATICSYGEERFNTPSLIEAADTAPFFHNNSVNTIEEAVSFYNTPEFNQSPGHLTSSGADRTVQIGSSQVVAVAQFLRAINALENIRNSNALLDQAKQLNADNGQELTKLAMADTQDAIEVLTEGQLIAYPEAVSKLRAAYKWETAASLLRISGPRNIMLNKAKSLKLQADALIVTRVP